MPSSSDVLVDAVAFNKQINFGQILTCIVVYCLLFWFSVSVWVYKDAQRRYAGGDPRTPLLIAIAVFFLFFPALILYLAVRPHDSEIDFNGYADGGVNVPLVNFVGDDGVAMTLELNIHKKPEQSSNNDIKVDINWESKQDKMKRLEMEMQENPDISFWEWVDGKKEAMKVKMQKFLESNKNKNLSKTSPKENDDKKNKDEKNN